MVHCWVGTVDGLCLGPVNTGAPIFFVLAPLVNFFAPSKSRLTPDVLSLNRLFIWPVHFSDASIAYAHYTRRILRYYSMQQEYAMRRRHMIRLVILLNV